MAGQCAYIDTVEARIDGELVRFVSRSGDEDFASCMSRAYARRLVANLNRLLDAADISEACADILPFKCGTG